MEETSREADGEPEIHNSNDTTQINRLEQEEAYGNEMQIRRKDIL